MFVFAFEGALFVFVAAKPAFKPLFALPPNRTPVQRQTTLIRFIHSK